MICKVKLVWDSESEAWYTETEDIPGLHLNSKSFDDLMEKVCQVAPEIIEHNLDYNGPVNIVFDAERVWQGAAV